MQVDKWIKRIAIIFMIVCAVILAIDVIKRIKISIDFMGMQSTSRISNSSDVSEIKYEPTDYEIANKDEVIDEIKNMVIELKAEHESSNKKIDADEIANIHKLENYFYEYKSYAITKYKLLNIAEELPKTYKATKGYSKEQLVSYFNEKKADIEYYYGITSSDKFAEFAKSLSFLGSGKVELMIVQTNSISFDYENDKLKFDVKVKGDNGNSKMYTVRMQYYKTSDNQVTPYLEFN